LDNKSTAEELLLVNIFMVRQESKNILNELYPSDTKKRKDIIEALCKAVSSSGIELEVTPEEIYLSLDEAITNAMEHGNQWDPRKNMEVAITAGRDEIVIAITDQGKGFSTRDIRNMLKNRDVLSNRGRGIYIINQFCKITWNAAGNQILLHFNRKK
jgi:anti-sigma regulatory factor (Ser/Thr protein kinase)